MKTHAKDYLKDFASSQEGWMKILIQEVIDTNGNIPQERLDKIFDSFINETSIPESVYAVSSTNIPKQKILLQILKHVSGVGALSENQEIKFSDSVTVLYGLNGSGKSSYFRILNELCGGNQKKDILQNIYGEPADLKPIKVSGSYKVGNDVKPITDWNPRMAAVPDLQTVKVFDSSYLTGLLNPRTPDETVVYPLGLHLFPYLTKVLDYYSSKVSQLIEKEKHNIPVIDTENLQVEYKNVFVNRTKFSQKQIKSISNLFNYTDTDETELLKYENKAKELQQINYDDKIQLLTQQNNSFSSFVNKVVSISNNISVYQKELIQRLEALAIATAKNEIAIQSSKILATLPKSDSNEWKKFIQAGQDYSKIIESTEPKKCPYCHQELKTEESLSIIQAYANFLNDTSEAELKAANKKINEIRENIKNLDVSIVISDVLKNSLKDFLSIDSKINLFKMAKQTLLDAKSGDEANILIPDFKNELQKINSDINTNIEKINGLNASNSDKEKQIKQLNDNISNLKQKKTISEQKDEINRYFDIFTKIDTLIAKQLQFRTTEITKLANQANQTLLTSSLEQKLANELDNLGRNDLKVILQTTNGVKGKCNTQLILKGNHKVTDILSEGEQKAVGLAVFFAEIQDRNAPIILDDPTNSLDHRIISKLVNRLFSFDNQIILFTHHQFLVDLLGFNKKGHFCDKYGEQTCGKQNKHVFVYQIDESINTKGIIYKFNSRNSTTMISKIESEINLITSNDLKDIPKNMRKCVEYLIDEKILKEQLLRKYSTGQTIGWDKLKEVNPSESNVIEKLHEIHQRVSGGEIHVDSESIENPLTPSELVTILADLKSIKEGTYR